MDKIKIALFGGSFDPVTDAHKEIIVKLSERFDRAVVMPTAVSPFKTAKTASESGVHRVEMLKRAVRGLQNVTVSRYELKKDGVSYTVDTLEHLKEKYDGAEIYTVIGSEELPRLNEWKDAAKLKTLTTFYVVERGGFALDVKSLNKIKSEGFNIKLAPFTVADVSSSEVKIERAFGKEKLPAPKSVTRYIVKNGLYNDYRAITDRYEEFGLKKERIEHTRRVALAAVKLAKRYGVSSDEAITAALLHDIAKETDERQLVRLGLPVPSIAEQMPEKIRHAEYGAVIAERLFGVENENIIEAIRQHTTGGKNMTKLAEVVFLADYIEEGRMFGVRDEVALTARESLEKAMELALGYEIAYLNEQKDEIYPLTQKAYNRYKKLDRQTEEERNEEIKPKAVKQKKERTVKSKDETKQEEKTEQAIKEPLEEREEPSIKTEQTEQKRAEQERVKDGDVEASHTLALEIGKYLSEKKASEVTLIDVSERTVITDYFVIASASSTTAVRALADYVDEKLSKGKGLEPLHRDNNPQWYAVDYGRVIVHIFLKNVRLIYDLERLWSDGTNTETVES